MIGPERVVTNGGLTAVGLVEWALYGLSAPAHLASGTDAQTEVARLREAPANAVRDALSLELGRFKETFQDLQHLQKQVLATTQELKYLEYLRSRVSVEIDAMRQNPRKRPVDHRTR